MSEEKKALTKTDVDELSSSFWNGESDGKQLKEVNPRYYNELLRQREPFEKLMNLWKSKFHEIMSAPIQELALDQKIRSIFTDLAPKTPLEKLLAERIVVCYLETIHIDIFISVTKDFRKQDILLKRQNSAHRRYLTAVKALAQVRRLQLPMVQVNIGENQINAGNVSLPGKAL